VRRDFGEALLALVGCCWCEPGQHY